MVRGSCLCGDVVWQVDGSLSMMTHCHCSMCRKAHGAPFATYVGCAGSDLRRTAGDASVSLYESSPGFFRAFCGRCGAVVPGETGGERAFLPAGCLDDDPGCRPEAHIFYASRLPWFEACDELPRFEELPPGFDVPAVEEPPLPDGTADEVRGSCLCRGVRWRSRGAPGKARNCHCSRCRKARSAAYTANLFVAADDFAFTAGDELLRSYRVPDARHFTHFFCGACGGSAPRVDPGRGIAVIPMGSLDDDPGVLPDSHIYVASKAPWFEIEDDLPRYDEGPP